MSSICRAGGCTDHILDHTVLYVVHQPPPISPVLLHLRWWSVDEKTLCTQPATVTHLETNRKAECINVWLYDRKTDWMRNAIKERVEVKRICESISAFTHTKSLAVRHMAFVCAQGDFLRSNDDSFGKMPTEPEPGSAWIQCGHYVNAKGSLMPGKLEGEILNICRCMPGRSVRDWRVSRR